MSILPRVQYLYTCNTYIIHTTREFFFKYFLTQHTNTKKNWLKIVKEIESKQKTE